MGDNPYCHKDVEIAMNNKLPMVVVDGSSMSTEILELREEVGGFPVEEEGEGGEPATGMSKDALIQKLGRNYPFIRSKESSEDLASIVHLMLAVSL